MKTLLPPFIGIFLTYYFAQGVNQYVLGNKPLDDSGVAGVVLLIELIMKLTAVGICYLAHGLIVVKVVDKLGKKAYFRLLVGGEVVSALLSIGLMFVLLFPEHGNVGVTERVELSFALFVCSSVFWISNLYTYKWMSKYVA